MHLAEGILPLSHAAAWAALAAPAVALGARRLARAWSGGEPGERALVGMAGAATFALTLLPIPVPVAGATSHLCATPLLGLLFGPLLPAAPVALLLALQALFFAHGGLTTLGANALTLGVIGPATAWGLARALRRVGAGPRVAAGVACALGQIAVYAADAAILALGLAEQAPPLRTFAVVLAGFAPIQLPLAVLEGALSAAALRALAARRPELVPAWLRGAGAPGAAAPLPLGLLGLLALSALLLPGCAYQGADELVLEGAAAAAGRPAAPIDLGELGHGAAIAAMFGAGFLAGMSFQRLRGERAPRS